MTNNDDLALKLKAAAEMATPGKWERGDGKHGGELLVYCDDALGSAVCEATSTYNSIPKLQRISNLTFIATANPANILALLAERDADKAENVQLRQRIAELEARTVAYADPQAFLNFKAGAARREWMWRNPGEDLIPVFTAPPAPVASTLPDGLRMALSNAGIAAPESDEVLFATHEKYVQLLVDWVKDRKPFAPAQVAVPDGWRQWVDDVVEYLKGGLETDGELEAEGSIEAKRLLACRAAMLKVGPVTGWIKCSERMPDDSEAVLTMVDKGYKQTAYWDTEVEMWRWGDEKWHPGEITHWMPLPAAPEQEV